MPAWLAPNRLVAIVTALLAIVGAIATLAADLDAPAAGAYAASALVLLGVVHKWLTGWQAWEARRGAQEGAGAIPAPGGSPGPSPVITPLPEPPMPALEYLSSRLVDALAASAPAGRIYTAPAPGPGPEYLEVQTLGQTEPTRIPLRPREEEAEEGPEDLEDALAAVSSLEPEPEDLYVADPAYLPTEERGAP